MLCPNFATTTRSFCMMRALLKSSKHLLSFKELNISAFLSASSVLRPVNKISFDGQDLIKFAHNQITLVEGRALKATL